MPPRSGKVFVVKGGGSLEDIHGRLDGWEVSESYARGDFKAVLIHNVEDLEAGDHYVNGVYVYDYVLVNTHRGTVVNTPVTRGVPFRFFEKDGDLWLVVIVSKAIANVIAVALAGICAVDVREASIFASEMNSFLKVNDNAKVVLFDNLDIPGVDKNTLYGSELVQTNLFKEFSGRGSPKWVVTEEKVSGYTIGLGGDVGVTVYNNVELNEYLKLVEQDIIPLVRRGVSS